MRPTVPILRDHLNDLELIFSMLSEAATTEITRSKEPKGFPENKKTAREGGSVAGKAREDLEKRTDRRIVSKENYLGLGKPNKLRQLGGE